MTATATVAETTPDFEIIMAVGQIAVPIRVMPVGTSDEFLQGLGLVGEDGWYAQNTEGVAVYRLLDADLMAEMDENFGEDDDADPELPDTPLAQALLSEYYGGCGEIAGFEVIPAGFNTILTGWNLD